MILMKRLFTMFAAALLVGLSFSPASAQHGHLNAGAGPQQELPALGAAQGDQLFFANGGDYASGFGYALTLAYTTTGTYAGYYQGHLTTTAIAATVAHGGPAAFHAAPGSFLQLKLLAVTGPAGGTWSFWDEGATAPTFSLVAANPAMWALSENDGSLGSDPYGHIHGRRYTTDMPGLYTVSFQLVDTSINGTGGGPLHTPSEVFQMDFNAVPEPAGGALLAIGGGALFSWSRRRRSW